MILCEYGCGQEAKYKFKNGRYCCSNNISRCPKIKEVIGKRHEGMIINQKTRDAVRKARKGKKDSLETRKKKSESRKGFKNPMYGKRRSIETKKKISKALKGKKPHNKYTIEYMKENYPLFSKIEEMRYNPKVEGEIQVHCKNHNCKNSKEQGGWFTPSHEQIYYRKNCIENEGEDYSYFYCCNKCKNECPLFNLRSDPIKNKDKFYTQAEYEIWKNEVKELDNYECQICGSKKDLHAHHILPQKLEPYFSLDPENGICLCKRCHYKYGHSEEECKTINIGNKICI